ncbi:MAG: ankyrin repeat domain-containing protein [Curvibacter lanceolatus]|uniref:ankyrin repeat domain-containing protein n=1 Tax=Curvibacter lanceolatus TaxID=86182 RepID=UPI000369D007|nr:ankyrin repeat domain-containing protein [Curvibacter lanceolatus]MBV5294067.1 ankyrin repeat domain-containing protein [Curvibacter lanceolatus]
MNPHRRQCLLALGASAGLSLLGQSAHAGSFEDFFTAIRRNDASTLQTLIRRGFDPNTVDEAGQPGLMMAVDLQSVRAVEALLSAPNIQAEVRNKKGESALMLCAIRGDLALAKLLIEHDADVNKTGWTPLHYAASGTTQNQVEMVRLLLDNSAYIDAASPNGSTPLMMAAMYGRSDVLKVLIEEGADASLRNEKGLTAIDFAQQVGRTANVEAIASALRARQPKGTW